MLTIFPKAISASSPTKFTVYTIWLISISAMLLLPKLCFI
jgi:hypothetical protein